MARRAQLPTAPRWYLTALRPTPPASSGSTSTGVASRKCRHLRVFPATAGRSSRRTGRGSRRHVTHFGPDHATASATWSPDGSAIVFADSGMGGNDDLYVMRADGGDVRRLTRTPPWESAAVWLRP